ncbi:MAG: AmmeMemoRadiSam system protein B [Nitrospirae bacterium]|nr:AmmeMemoRadiSam system protein B [Nitrospirota bacterium]
MIRRPAVAGQFYQGSSAGLLKEVQRYIESAAKEKVMGIISPHAGLMYSGSVAGAVYSRIEIPHTFILIGPNHTGLGKPVSIMSDGEWEVPTGALKIDKELAKRIMQGSSLIQEDSAAHLMEHSLEVQLPFILHFSSEVLIVPVTMMAYSLDVCRAVGLALADAVQDTKYSVTIVASSDMSHYEPDSAARAKDKKAINEILDIDPEGLHKTVTMGNISMCGIAPATAMLFAVKKLGAKKASLVKYMTSGDAGGDYSSVVGYAGIVIK